LLLVVYFPAEFRSNSNETTELANEGLWVHLKITDRCVWSRTGAKLCRSVDLQEEDRSLLPGLKPKAPALLPRKLNWFQKGFN